MYYSTTYPSPLGLITIASTEDALVGLWIEGQKYFIGSLKEPLTERPDLPILIQTSQWLDRYFSGEQPSLTELKLAPIGSDFRQRVWSILCQIPYGETVTYGLYAAQERGRLFIGPGVPVYEGMIVGASPKAEDITVNVCKKKHITNTRASGSDDALKLTPPTQMSLEQCLEFIADDELVEITPESIRMRKRILSKEQRMKQAFRKK